MDILYAESASCAAPVSGCGGTPRGRFAPSPTGPLHFGSLVAVLGSCLQARRQGGHWFLRIEDLDRPRCRDQVANDMLRTLAAFGFAWDGEIVWQSRRAQAYQDALTQLTRQGQLYPCACSRSELADSALAADGAAVYPGSCRHGLPEAKAPRAWRVRVPETRLAYNDALQGRVEQDLAREVGDFVVLRADGIVAYQLAVVVDDAQLGITEVVRGADLLASTPRQILLQRLLDYPTPTYAHLPVVLDGHGEKLSKQTRAEPLDTARPQTPLLAALRFLGQEPPAVLAEARLDELWQWAHGNWSLSKVPRQRGMPWPQPRSAATEE